MKALILILATFVVLIHSPLGATAATGTFRFESTEPAFRYVSGDLPCEISFSLSGKVSLLTDESTSDIQLDFHEVRLHSPQTICGGPYCDGSDLDGTLLTSSPRGFDTAVSGERLNGTDYHFGPSLSDDSRYLREFSLTVGSESIRLIGSSLFYGADGGSYFIDGSLVSVPEPSGTSLVILAIAAVFFIRRSLTH
jgi:hypothetical protein